LTTNQEMMNLKFICCHKLMKRRNSLTKKEGTKEISKIYHFSLKMSITFYRLKKEGKIKGMFRLSLILYLTLCKEKKEIWKTITI
jgi:hypothetical protein